MNTPSFKEYHISQIPATDAAKVGLYLSESGRSREGVEAIIAEREKEIDMNIKSNELLRFLQLFKNILKRKE